MRRKGFAGFVAVMALVLFGASLVQAKMVPKVDHFILFVDQSGSMYMTHGKQKDVKIRLAKQVLADMNEMIPELGYQGAIELFAPLKEVLAPRVYDRAAFSQAIVGIPEDQGIYGRRTPMGPGISGIDPLLARMDGRKAVIIFSDGEANEGTDPVMEARSLASKYSNLCFHVVSFAETEYGQNILNQISQIGNCVQADGLTLLTDKQALAQFVKDVFYEEVPEEEEVIVLRGIHFDFDKYDIKPEWVPVLDEGVEILKKHPDIKIIIEGHTDSIGTDEYNQKLSERRAKAVFDYFVSHGISPDRMKTVGFGESRPKADNSTAEGRAINRRVELKVVK
ncbi:OmpA family protein [Thermodesulforhabdus norvegica]|uniref:OmpA-OmpF porin, OOP family n=1 Tax=Thermodesulforhabdus norvegica TaxID=39841 RepID=A0A1I4UKP2_9BACT|nr:OmpA family protein [Thermodesulforhabdus norvegica]SFM89584.1 OmpA-OmpF porin, OOP family [Thermodesulforhabdus norvegica]